MIYWSENIFIDPKNYFEIQKSRIFSLKIKKIEKSPLKSPKKEPFSICQSVNRKVSLKGP